ncbi:nucleotidyltransferase domain-containing protein [Egicoccus sp. AB-alg6-2]|uniref:nucleotidyltransferase domain-containing protein n=1 Tax=Egicoccus sp. AB-alg6-2 TaxID=3242692 RepID=UPI00359CC1F7
MVRDPREGVTEDGTITTGADARRIPAAYRETIADAVSTLRDTLGELAHSVYVYGSVATGQARPPRSDLDLIVVVETSAPEAVRAAATGLSHRHRDLVREVAIGSVDLETLRRQDRVGRAERCFLKHYAVHLAGPDLRADHPTCRATEDLACGFNRDLRRVLDQVRPPLLGADDGDQRAAAAARACRKILMAAATLLSVREGGWSTDRRTAVELVGRHAPELYELAADALRYGEDAPMPVAPDVGRAVEIVDRLGGWLVDEYARSAVRHDSR